MSEEWKHEMLGCYPMDEHAWVKLGIQCLWDNPHLGERFLCTIVDDYESKEYTEKEYALIRYMDRNNRLQERRVKRTGLRKL